MGSSESNIDSVVQIAERYLDWCLTPSMRAITVGVLNSNRLLFRAYIEDGSTLVGDTDKLADMGVYVWSMVYDIFYNQWSECIPSNKPFSELENLGTWTYIRPCEIAN